MPILLTTPKVVSPGPGQETITYTQLKIAGFDLPPPGKRIILKLQYGDTVNNVWISKASIFKLRVQDIPEIKSMEYNFETEEVEEVISQAEDLKFTDMVATVLTNSNGLRLWDVVASSLYQHLIDQHPEDSDFQGTIVTLLCPHVLTRH